MAGTAAAGPDFPDPLPVGGASPRAASPAAPAAALDLRTAARAALALNPDVEGAHARAEAAEHQLDAARAAWRPRAELRVASGRGRLESVTPDLLTDRDDRSLVLRQTLVDEPARHEVSRQQRNAEAAQAWSALIRGLALQETGNAMLALVGAETGLRAAVDHERRLVALMETLQDEAAPQAGADRDRVGARLANVRSQLAEARAAVQAAARNLERLTGLLPTALALGDLVGDPPGLASWLPADDAAALAAMRERNDELRARRLEVEAGSAEVASRAGRHLPRLELEMGHYRNRALGGFPGAAQDTRGFAVLTWPLFSGGADLAQQRAAEARRVDARSRLRAAEGRLTQAVETAFANLASAAERRDTVRAELDNNRRLVAALLQRPYGPGTSITDVLDAYQREAQSRVDALQVELSLTRTRWQLAQLTGVIEAVFTGADGAAQMSGR